MYLIQCVNAYTAVETLMERDWDYATAYALVTLKRNLAPHAEFFTKEELKLAREYARIDESGKMVMSSPGAFVFAQPEKAGEYARRRTELGMLQVQEDFPMLRAPEPESIRPSVLEALESFIVFGTEDGGYNGAGIAGDGLPGRDNKA